jgi:hypothetical protein
VWLCCALSSCLQEPVKPIKASAQKKVAVPAGLDLSAWIVGAPEPEEQEDAASYFRECPLSEPPYFGTAPVHLVRVVLLCSRVVHGVLLRRLV